MSVANDENVSKKLQTLDQYLKVEQLEESIKRGKECIEHVKDSDTILVLGNTGVGKSTTICYLCGAEMVEKDVEIAENIQGDFISTKQKVIDSAEPFESFVIGHRQASETSFINVIPIPDKTDLVICDVPGFEDSRGAAIDLSNTICLNEAIQKTKTLRIVLLLNYHELLSQRGKLIRDSLNLISGCFKNRKFEENISKIQVHYTHSRDKTIENDIYPKLIAVQNEIKPDEERAKALLDHIIRQASPKAEQTISDNKKTGMLCKSMIIDPLNKSHRLELLNMICEPKQVKFDNPAEILEFQPNTQTNNLVKLFVKSFQSLVTEFMNENKYFQAFQILEKIQKSQTYVKLQQITDSISAICEGMKLVLFTKQKNITHTIQQTIVSKGKFYTNTLEDIEDYIKLIRLWDEKKELYFEAKGLSQLSHKVFNEDIMQLVQEYMDGQLDNVVNYQIKDQIALFSSFLDELQSLIPYFDKLGQIKQQLEDTLNDVIKQYESQSQQYINQFVKLDFMKQDANKEKKQVSEFPSKTDQLDQILVSFDILLLWQDKFSFLNERYKSIHQSKKKYFEDQLNVVSEKMQTELKKLVADLSDQINNQSSQKSDNKIQINDLQSRICIFQSIASNRKANKLFPNLTKVYVDLIKDCNSQIKQFLETLTQKLQKHLKSQQLHQWKNHLIEIDKVKNLVSHSIKSLRQLNLEDFGSEDIEKKYLSFKSKLLNKVNDIVEEIKHYTMILSNSDSELDVLQLRKLTDKSDPSQQQNLSQTKVSIDQIKTRPAITRLFDKLKNKIALIKNLDWMDSYFDTDTVSRSLRKAQKRVNGYLESVTQKIASLIPSISSDAAVWHQIAEYYFQVVNMNKFSESIQDVEKKVKQCKLMITKQLDNLEKDCQELNQKLEKCKVYDFGEMQKLHFTLEQLKQLPEFAGIDTIASKIIPYLQKLQDGWQNLIVTAYKEIMKISDGNELIKKNQENLEEINLQLCMFLSMQEFQELNDIQLPDMNRNFSIYQNLIKTLRECYNNLAKIKSEHIFNKKTDEVAQVDSFFRQSFRLFKNHLPGLSEYVIDFNEMSNKFTGEIETDIKEKKWQSIADYIRQNEQSSNLQLSTQIQTVKQNILSFHETEFESLVGMIHQLIQNEPTEELQAIFQQKLQQITDIEKHFGDILDQNSFKVKEEQLQNTLTQQIKQLQAKIEDARTKKKLLKMNQSQMKYTQVLDQFERSLLWTKESEDLKNKFDTQFRDNFMSQQIDYQSFDYLKLLEELKQIKDQSLCTIASMRQIYADKYEQATKSVEIGFNKKVQNAKKVLEEGKFKKAKNDLMDIYKIQSHFQVYINTPKAEILDLGKQIKDLSTQQVTEIQSQFENLEDPKSLEELNNKIKVKYNKANNPQVYKYLKLHFKNMYTVHQQLITQIISISPLDFESVTVNLLKLSLLSNVKSVCNEDKNFEKKIVEICISILKKVLEQIKSTHNKVTTNTKLAQQDILDYYFMLRLINLIKTNRQLQSEAKTFTQIKQYSQQINQALSKQIRDTYQIFKKNLDNLHIFELQKSLSELKKLNPIISFIKNTDESQLTELELSDELISYKKLEDVQTYEVSEEQMNKVINNLEMESHKHFESKEYDKLCKKLKSLKELSVLNHLNQTGSDNQYSKLVQEKNWFIRSVGNKMNAKIQNGIFDKELQEMFSQLEKMGQAMKEIQDIGLVIEKIKAQSMGLVKKKLESARSEFKAISYHAPLAGEVLTQIARLRDDVPIIKRDVDLTLRKCMDYYVSDVGTRDAKIGELWDYFQQQDRNSITRATHNPQYVLSKFKLLSDSDNTFNEEQKQMFQDKKFAFLKKEQQDQLEKMYTDYTKRNNDLIYAYTIKKIGPKKEILESIKNNIEYKYQIENWNDGCKKQMNDLLAMVSTYWSLMGIKDDEVDLNKKTILKQPHASQIFSIMFLLGFDRVDPEIIEGTGVNEISFENKLIQILTGEGKSIILGLLAALLALIGYNVDVACYSKYLSQRDFEDFLPLFKELGIENKVSYGTFCDLSEKIINKAGDLREMSQNLLKGLPNQLSQDSKAKSILLIDEVDIFFSSDFYGQTYNPATLFQHPHLEYIMETLWKNQVLKNVYLSVEQVKQSIQYQQLIQNYPRFERFFNVHIRMMAQAIDKIGEHKYEVVNGKIGYKIGASSDSISTDVYYGYSTNFAYFKEFDRGNVTKQEKRKQIGINLQCGYYSYADAPKKYFKILGVTGTLETLHEESLRIISQYIQVMSAVPSQFGDSRFKFYKAKDIKVVMDEDNMFLTLAEMIDKGLQDLRPVLVFFRDTETLYRYKKSIHCKFKDPIIIEPKSENITHLVVKSTRKGQLVLLDRVFGRGTDFICLDKSIDDKGGILVIQTFFSQDKSEEQQIRGRTARQQRKGQYQLIVNAKDLEEDFHIKRAETKQYRESISTIYDGLLDKKRFIIWGEQLKKLTQSIVEADKKHKQTEIYLDQLVKNRRDEAIQTLIEFNFNQSKPDKTSTYHFIFCLDDSGSMKRTDGTPKTRWQKVVDAIQSFVQQRDQQVNGISEDIVSIIYYSNNAVSVCKFEPISNVMTIISQNPPRWGGTRFSTAIKLTQQILENEPSTHKSKSKIVMFLSDGGDRDSNTVLVSSINSLIAADNRNTGKIVSWWNMGFGPGAEASVLNQMSQLLKAQGGKYVTALNAAELQAKFIEIAQPEAIVMK